MKQEKEVEEYKKILEMEFKKIKEKLQTSVIKIDSEFIKKYFGNVAQAKLGMKILGDFEDALLMNGLAGIDCVSLGLDFSMLSQEEFEHIPFDTRTIFSDKTKEQFHPDEIIERAKNFGLGLEELPITGNGIHIAIKDENCNPYLIDRKNTNCSQIAEYTKVNNGTVSHIVDKEDVEHMHGLTTTSLLASQSCGVAKGASIHFFHCSIDEYVQSIINHNRGCKSKGKMDEMILVASGSWGDKAFKLHRDLLRANGCELVCANNFNQNFGEFTNNGNVISSTLDFEEDEIEKLKEDYTDYKEKIEQLSKKDKVRIPISRTYHQVGREENGEEIFKYQSSFSTSWGIPQVAGLLAVFKEMDRNITFEQFLEYAEKTATDIGKMRIINPKGIYREIMREKASRFHDQKNASFFEEMQAGKYYIPIELIKKTISQEGIGTTEINEYTQAIRDKVQRRDEKTEERE